MVNLQKGQKIDLTKTNPGLTTIIAGLGWDPVKSGGGGGGLLGGLFGGGGAPKIDCDASVYLLNKDGKLAQEEPYLFWQFKKPLRKRSSHWRQPHRRW